ncbi:type II toxin-antitoxin system YoeB family toxin [Streptomyces sp. NPDC002577]
MRDGNFAPGAWDDFQHWPATDRKMVRRIVRLIGEIQRRTVPRRGRTGRGCRSASR